MSSFHSVLLLVAVAAHALAETLNECSTAALLRRVGFPESSIAKMVCTTKHESTFRCDAVGTSNRDGTRDYGLLQVNSRYWCTGGPHSPRVADCGVSCSAVLSCEAGARCAKKVYSVQGITAWYGYRNFKSECDRYRLPAACANGGTYVPQPIEPVVPPQQLGGMCTKGALRGTCEYTSTCAARGGSAYATRLGANGCQNIPSTSVQCCIPGSTPTPPATIGCSYAGSNGACLPTQSCASPKRSYKSRDGAIGCGAISDANVQCCATPPRSASVRAVAPPIGRACGLAFPVGCSALRGVDMTWNVGFSDEMKRLNVHARNAGYSTILRVVESFRPADSPVVGAADSRMKVGFAVRLYPNNCDIDCLCVDDVANIVDDGARLFLAAVMADSNLRWAGAPNGLPSTFTSATDAPLFTLSDGADLADSDEPAPSTLALSDAVEAMLLANGCNRDVYLFEGSDYALTQSFDAEAACLNEDWSAGRKVSFNCLDAAALLNDDADFGDDASADGESAASGDGGATTLGGGAIAGIVIGSLFALLLIGGLVALCVLRARANKADAMVFVNEQYGGAKIDMLAPKASVTTAAAADAMTSARVATDSARPAATESARAGNGQYACGVCQKSYAFAEDLAAHVAQRH